jgi:hypothetical protein
MKYETKNVLSLADHRYLSRNQTTIINNSNSNSNNKVNNYTQNISYKINKNILVNMFILFGIFLIQKFDEIY